MLSVVFNSMTKLSKRLEDLAHVHKKGTNLPKTDTKNIYIIKTMKVQRLAYS